MVLQSHTSKSKNPTNSLNGHKRCMLQRHEQICATAATHSVCAKAEPNSAWVSISARFQIFQWMPMGRILLTIPTHSVVDAGGMWVPSIPVCILMDADGMQGAWYPRAGSTLHGTHR